MTAPDPAGDWIARHEAEWAEVAALSAARLADARQDLAAARAGLAAHLAAAQARVLSLYAEHAMRGAA